MRLIIMNNDLDKKSKCLKLAIERYNMFKDFIDEFNTNHLLTKYVTHINNTSHTLSESMKQYYDKLITSYNDGNYEPLLSNLYNRLLDADEHKSKVASELKSMLNAYESKIK